MTSRALRRRSRHGRPRPRRPTTTNFTHDQLNRDAAIAAASGYDANGNLTSDGVRTFTYDAENRLTSVTGGSAPVSLAYDPWGRLWRVTSGTTVTQFRYSGSDLIEEGVGTTSACCTTRTRGYIPIGPDEPAVWIEEGYPSPTLRWFHQDRLGSVIATSTVFGGPPMTIYTYGPYGEPQSWAGSRFRYTGQIAIPEAQLYHYKARAYDPGMGRFLQTDPIGYGDGGNIYAYVHGDAVNGTDPSGTNCGGRCDPGCGGPYGGWDYAAFGDHCGEDRPMMMDERGLSDGGPWSNAYDDVGIPEELVLLLNELRGHVIANHVRWSQYNLAKRAKVIGQMASSFNSLAIAANAVAAALRDDENKAKVASVASGLSPRGIMDMTSATGEIIGVGVDPEGHTHWLSDYRVVIVHDNSPLGYYVLTAYPILGAGSGLYPGQDGELLDFGPPGP